MGNPLENKRTDSIRVRLSPDMMERFDVLAKAYGMPPATLAAFAIAGFVQAQENNAKMTRMAVLDMVRQQMPEMMGMAESMLEAGLPAMQKALAQENLPLDGEASKADA